MTENNNKITQDNLLIANAAISKFPELEGDLEAHIGNLSKEQGKDVALVLAEMFGNELDNESFADENSDVHLELRLAHLYGSNPKAHIFMDNMSPDGTELLEDENGLIELPQMAVLIVDHAAAFQIAKLQALLKGGLKSLDAVGINGVRVEYLQDNGLDYDEEKMMLSPKLAVDKDTIQIKDELMHCDQRIFGSELAYDAGNILEKELFYRGGGIDFDTDEVLSYLDSETYGFVTPAAAVEVHKGVGNYLYDIQSINIKELTRECFDEFFYKIKEGSGEHGKTFGGEAEKLGITQRMVDRGYEYHVPKTGEDGADDDWKRGWRNIAFYHFMHTDGITPDNITENVEKFLETPSMDLVMYVDTFADTFSPKDTEMEM